MVQIFENGDQEYFDWMNDNPEGYILNTYRHKGRFFFLHKSGCTHITEYEDGKGGSYTSGKVVKVGSRNLNDLIAYCYQNRMDFNGSIGVCKTCRPEFTLEGFQYPEEREEVPTGFSEGSRMLVLVNRYERDYRNREACLRYYGAKCQCCGFEYSSMYGDIGEGFIEVHHLVPLHQGGESYIVDPIKDLIPLCSNCHAMIHKRSPNPFSVEELKEIIQTNKGI